MSEATPTAPAVPALTLDRLPDLAKRIAASVTKLRWVLQEPEKALLERARAYQDIATEQDALSVGQDLVAIKRIRRAGETHYELLKRPFNMIRQVILTYEGEDVSVWERAEKKLDRMSTEWRREKLRLEAQELQERQRIADLQAAEEHERQVQALEHVAEVETNPVVQEALLIEAEALSKAPVVAPQVTIESEVPIVPGLGFTKRYKAEIQGDAALLKFIKAIGAKKVPLKAAIGLKVAKDDENHDRLGVYTSPYINDYARANDGEVTWPGVTVVTAEGTTGR
jgi:hypothetical protein